MLMAYESENPIYGRVLNPHNLARVAGGSSGGEGALIAAGCSPWGIGSDVGGSIRIPASFNGIFGFKPSQTRFEWNKNSPAIHCFFNNHLHQDYIKPVAGPLAKSVKDLKTIMEIIADPSINQDINHSLPPLTWRKEVTKVQPNQKFKFGYYNSIDALFETSPANKRAVEEVVQALRQAGHKVVPFSIPSVEDIFSVGL